MDCLKNCSDEEAKTFESMSKAFFHFNPKYEKATLRSHDYIFTTLRNEILPAIEEDAYKFIFTTYSSDLDLCKMSDPDFRNAIDQNLGDFKKECKQKLHSKIKSAVIPYRQTPDNSISKNDIGDTISYVLECLQNDVEAKVASSFFKKKPIKIPPVKSHKDKADILRKLQRTLYLRKDTYAKELLNDIKEFFKGYF